METQQQNASTKNTGTIKKFPRSDKKGNVSYVIILPQCLRKNYNSIQIHTETPADTYGSITTLDTDFIDPPLSHRQKYFSRYCHLLHTYTF